MNPIQQYISETEKALKELYLKGVPMGDGVSMENPWLKYAKEQIQSFLLSRQLGLIELVKSLMPEEKEIHYEELDTGIGIDS